MINETKSKKLSNVILCILIPICAYGLLYIINYIVQFTAVKYITNYLKHNKFYTSADALEKDIMLIFYENISLLYVISGIIFTVCVFIIYKKTRLIQFSDIKNKKNSTLTVANVLMSGLFLGAFTNIALNVFEKVIPEKWIEANQESVNTFRYGKIQMAILSVVVIAPIIEEIVFRGFLYGCMKRLTGKIWIAAIITSIIFGVFHGNILQGIYTATLSFVMIWVYEQTSSIKASMLFHGALNFSSVLSGIMMMVVGYVAAMIISLALGVFFLIQLHRSVKMQCLEEKDNFYIKGDFDE